MTHESSNSGKRKLYFPFIKENYSVLTLYIIIIFGTFKVWGPQEDITEKGFPDILLIFIDLRGTCEADFLWK